MDDSRRLPPNAINATTTRLLHDLRRDDSAAWRELVYLYSPVVRFWIIRAGVDGKADTADIVQDVFMAVRANVGTFERAEGKAKFRAWLKTITRSKVMDYFRKMAKQPGVGAGGSTAQARLAEVAAIHDGAEEDEDTQQEQDLIVRRALEMIRGEFREATWQAFKRTAMDGISATDVAQELDLSPAAVRKNKSRVLQRLRQVLSDGGAD